MQIGADKSQADNVSEFGLKLSDCCTQHKSSRAKIEIPYDVSFRVKTKGNIKK